MIFVAKKCRAASSLPCRSDIENQISRDVQGPNATASIQLHVLLKGDPLVCQRGLTRYFKRPNSAIRCLCKELEVKEVAISCRAGDSSSLRRSQITDLSFLLSEANSRS